MTTEEWSIIILTLVCMVGVGCFAVYNTHIHKHDDSNYPDACFNWNYVKGIGNEMSDYYFDTDRESCETTCTRVNQTDKGTVGWMAYVRVCECCKARGQYP